MNNAERATLGADGGPTVEAENHSQVSDLDIERWAAVAVETLAAERVPGGHLDLSFVDPGEMAELNRLHMGHDGPTDVLSFPLEGDELELGAIPVAAADGSGVDTPPRLLGDVVICPQVAMDQAPEHCGDPDTEFTLLVVHGVLHILGHDHGEADEEAVMIEHETTHLRRYGLAHPGPVRPDPGPSS